jgi:ABC-type Zn uptake system ZnuABC Zn-binding protein ZnuA
LWPVLIVLSLSALATGGCLPATADNREHGEEEILALPELEPAGLGGAPLQVIATTSIIGDVVAQVGGEAIELTTLMGAGQDPHSYEPTPQQMATVSRAHVVFVNGWDLEEALVHDLKEIAAGVPVVPISAGIEPLAFGEHRDHADQETQHTEEEQAHTGTDPHVWFSVHNVEQWVENVERVLAALDPAHAGTYEWNAETYRARLEELATYVQGQLSSIPAEKRYLVTNHDSLGYLAHAYDLRVLGTVLPAASTVAEPSASEMAALVATMEEHGLCTIFAETTASARLAQTVSEELAGCDEVAVLQLYTGALGPPGSGADSYVGMLRYNVDTIVEGLR